MKDLDGKVAVITGAASGIGRALALECARKGMRVLLADIEEGPLRKAEQEVATLAPETLAVPTDVSQADSVAALADAAFGRFGAVHLLCNNAGVASGGLPLEALTLRDWEWVLGVNLWGVVHGITAFLPRMLAGGEPGHIVNTASILGLATWANSGPYVASKFAVVGLSEALARELEGRNVAVSILCPVFVDTSIFESDRNRPAHLDVEREGPNLRARAQTIGGSWLAPEAVAARVLRGVEAGDFYLFTHPETAGMVEERMERIRAAYPDTSSAIPLAIPPLPGGGRKAQT